MNDSGIDLQIWDLSGQKLFQSLVPMYTRTADFVAILYDITSSYSALFTTKGVLDKESFENLQKWIEIMKNGAQKDEIVALVANKLDLEVQRYDFICYAHYFFHSNRVITTEEGKAVAAKHEFLFREISAKSGENFRDLMRDMLMRFTEQLAKPSKIEVHLK